MRCVVRRQGGLRKGTATATPERDRTISVFKKDPVEVCGEEYADEETTAQLLAAVEEAARTSVQVDIREYVAA